MKLRSFTPILILASSAAVIVACGSSGSSNEQSTNPTQPDTSSTSSSGASGSSGGGTSTSSSGASGGTSSSSSSSSSTSSGASSSSGTTSTSGAPPKSPGTIFTIVMENHDYAEIVGSPNAPYINSLIASYGLATNYADSGTHPSLPNYLTLISGDTQYPGFIDLDPTTTPFPVDKQNLGTQMQAAGIAWRSYQENMGSACALSGSGSYAPRHDPFLYFTDMQTKALCADKNVDYSNFAADLAAGTQRYMWITPNLTDDGHDPQNTPVTGLKDSDTWASTNIPKIIASAAYQNGGVIFLTWDEAEKRDGPGSADKVPMIIISPNIKSAGFQSSKAFSHKSYLATVEDMLGLPRLATVTSESNMATEFLK